MKTMYVRVPDEALESIISNLTFLIEEKQRQIDSLTKDVSKFVEKEADWNSKERQYKEDIEELRALIRGEDNDDF